MKALQSGASAISPTAAIGYEVQANCYQALLCFLDRAGYKSERITTRGADNASSLPSPSPGLPAAHHRPAGIVAVSPVDGCAVLADRSFRIDSGALAMAGPLVEPCRAWGCHRCPGGGFQRVEQEPVTAHLSQRLVRSAGRLQCRAAVAQAAVADGGNWRDCQWCRGDDRDRAGQRAARATGAGSRRGGAPQ